MEGRLLEGKYRVSRLIGEGGMGAVYEAEHTMIGRPVALKVLHGDFAKSPEALERFRREARAATAIRHPNIIEVTDMGATPEGQPFLVMELLEGSPLSALIGEGRSIPVERVVDLLSQVLDALEAAHGKGIVHRDLKPDNVFVVREGARSDFVKILDFGISKMTDPSGGGLSVTRTGSVMGTPNYMAPEQAMGRKDCDYRVDLWAAGVMLYEALTGRLPYLGDNYNELLTAILMTSPPTPRTVKPGIDPMLERVVLRAMAKEREKRFSSAGEFRAALNEALPFESVSPLPATRGTPTGPVKPVPSSAAATPGATAASPPPRPAAAVTLTPGAYDAPLVEDPRPARRSPWALYAGAAGIGLAGIVVAVILLSGSGSGTQPAGDAGTAPPTAPVAAGSGADAAEASATIPQADAGGAGAPDAGVGVPPSFDADAATERFDAASSDSSPGADSVAPPDRGLSSAPTDADAAADVSRPPPRDAGSPHRDARPPSDRGRPRGDAGGPATDGGAARDGGRPTLRRDYT